MLSFGSCTRQIKQNHRRETTNQTEEKWVTQVQTEGMTVIVADVVARAQSTTKANATVALVPPQVPQGTVGAAAVMVTSRVTGSAKVAKDIRHSTMR